MLTLMHVVIGRLGRERASLLLSRGREKLLITPSRERLGSDSIKVSYLKFHVVLVGAYGWRNLLSISLPTRNLIEERSACKGQGW
jgi:hypothetical protein